MNMINNHKQTIRIAANLWKNFTREYANVSDYKITWTRPQPPPRLTSEASGDQGINIDVKASDYCLKYDESPELKDASDLVKKMFTLEFQPRKAKVEVMRIKVLDLVKRHDLDLRSQEARIAITTSQIYYLQELLNQRQMCRRTKIVLKETIEKRRKYLSQLRKKDYRCFEWILERLNLIYKPCPSPPTQITRKQSLERLTEKHCNKIVQDKLEAYKTELKKMQKQFFIEKAEKLAFIREEELACGLEPTVSEEEIANVKQKIREYET